MKFLILLIVVFSTSLTAFAQTDFLSQTQADKVNDYLDWICPDTYCGGDLSFWPEGITCKGDSCTVEYFAQGNTSFDEDRMKTVFGNKLPSSSNKNVLIDYKEYKLDQKESYGTLKFSCVLKNLSSQLAQYNSVDDLFYELVVWNCITDIEKNTYKTF